MKRSERLGLYGMSAVRAGAPGYARAELNTSFVEAMSNIMWASHQLGLDYAALTDLAEDKFLATLEDERK
jgi:hypothetical protein